MSQFVRQTIAGNPTPTAPSSASQQAIWPLGGFKPYGSELQQDPDSLNSTQNVWVRDGVLEPRWRLSGQSIEPLRVAIPTFGNTTNPTSNGTRCLGLVPFVGPIASQANGGDSNSVVCLSGTSDGLAQGFFNQATSSVTWFPLSINTAGGPPSYGSAITTLPSLGTGATWRGAVVYDAADDINLCVLSTGSREHLFATDGRPKNNGGLATTFIYSRLSGVTPKAQDVVNFADRIVAWNCDGIPQRVQWHVEGDPTDWTGIGSGFQDLADMAGAGTRVFANADQLVLGSTRELWRGRFVGLPYVFAFTRIDGTIGMPYDRAALQTPLGIFWLGTNFMLYQMQGEQVTPFGAAVQNYLRENLKAPDLAFLTYSQNLNRLTLWHSTTVASYPTQALSYDFTTQTWSRDMFSHAFHAGFSTPLDAVSAGTQTIASTWVLDYSQPLGVYAFVATSAGTLGQLTESATSDFGTAVEEDALLGAINANNFTRRNVLLEARYDIGARTSSSVTASWSTDFGRTTGTSQSLALTANSYTSQIITYPKLNGQYFSPRLQSTNGGWQLRRLWTETEDGGRCQ